MKKLILFYLISILFVTNPYSVLSQQSPPSPQPPLADTGVPALGVPAPIEQQITLDFSNVDMPVLVKFVSELTGKNFLIDERVRGKTTLFSPSKIPVSRVYDVFRSVVELKGFTVFQNGDIYQIVPMAELPPNRAIHVYVLENTQAEDIAKILLPLMGARPPGAIRTTNRPQTDIMGVVQIVPDKVSNSLIVTASQEDYEILKQVISKIDKRKKQVYLEAAVLDVATDKVRELGVSWTSLFAYADQDNPVGVSGGFNRTPLSFAELIQLGGQVDVVSKTFGKINIQTLLSAIQSNSGVNVLSTPQILATDNQKAEIIVGQNIPFPSSSSQTVGGNVQTTVERKDVGITLRFTPRIMENKKVSLDLYQEVSSVSDSGSALGPITKKSSATTSVVVQDGHTVFIGGLIRDNANIIERKIPLLGDIPLLGWFFKYKKKQNEKTNLMILLTPHIVLESDDLDAILDQQVGTSKKMLEENQVDPQKERQRFLEGLVNRPKS